MDKDLSTSRLFCKSVIDDKHSNTQYIKQEHNQRWGGGGGGGGEEREGGRGWGGMCKLLSRVTTTRSCVHVTTDLTAMAYGDGGVTSAVTGSSWKFVVVSLCCPERVCAGVITRGEGGQAKRA